MDPPPPTNPAPFGLQALFHTLDDSRIPGEKKAEHMRLIEASTEATLRQAADAGHPTALYALGLLHECIIGGDHGLAAAVDCYQQAADAGHASAQCRIGLCYYQGLGRPKDVAQEIAWYEKAAAQDHAIALLNLARTYDHGEGVPVDTGKARDYMRRAAELGYAAAQVKYGTSLYSEEPNQQALAFDFCLRAANQGDMYGCHQVASAYASGQGIEQDPEEAVRWFLKAAEAGLPQSQLALHSSYKIGLGVVADPAAARYWLRKSAESGLPVAIAEWEKSEGLSRN